jgi:hypothetical protein
MKAENLIIGICGHKGSGKTTLLTFFAYSEFKSKNKPSLFSNYKLNFNFKWLDAFSLLINWDAFKNSSIIIDELHEYADSRNSSSMQNRLISAWFLQSRHTSSNIYYSTQFFDQVDKRIRRITDIDIMCENLKTDIDNDGDDDLFKFIIYDTRDRKFTERLFYAKPIFDMYDSTERINPFMISKEKQKELLKKIECVNEEKFKQ